MIIDYAKTPHSLLRRIRSFEIMTSYTSLSPTEEETVQPKNSKYKKHGYKPNTYKSLVENER
ncbi:hypothetical protein WAF17_15700 [Bernardetia sp. ABR2-2B]|uniref:hypothetical protein n=1 Tax=Bernardetia sp. ABR2-2B TaxID=3127472 RepID=UPI0030D3468B